MACSKEVSKDQLQPSYICIHGSNFFQLSVPEWASLIAQLVKNPTAMQETPFDFWVGEDRLPTPVFLGFPCGKESTYFRTEKTDFFSFFHFE